MSYQNEQSTFQVPSSTGGPELKLFCQRWIPSNAKPGHNLVIHHGLGEHSDRYGNFLAMLEGTGITVYAYDLRGHGRSGGKQGQVRNLAELASDLGYYLDFIKKEYGVEKPLLYGNSMGGAAVLTFVGQSQENQDKLSSILVAASALGVDKNCYQSVMSAVLKLLKGLIPMVTVPSGLDINKLTHDQSVIDAYKNDPLCHDMISVGLAFSLLEDGQKFITPTASSMTLPIMMAHGELDQNTAPWGTKGYFEQCASEDKTLKIYPGCYHEVHNELKENKEKVLADYKAFITSHM